MDNKNKEKERFQLERAVFFSDAVFAIAITLLIIEIKIPHFEGPVTETMLANSLLNQLSEWIGFIISFSIIGVYWNAHHRTFGYLERIDKKLMWLNLFFLMTIVIMPFTTEFYSIYTLMKVPFIVYCLNISATGFLSLICWNAISDPASGRATEIHPGQRNYLRARALIVPVVFLSAAALSLFTVMIPRFMPALIPVLLVFIVKHYKKKYGEVIE